MATFGYARTSTDDQKAGLNDQIAKLEEFCTGPDDRVEIEEVSAKNLDDRPRLESLLDFLRSGDLLVVTSADRLARSLPDLISIEARLRKKGAHIKLMKENLDTSTPEGRLMFGIIGSVNQFEREVMLERQKVGIAAAKVAGKYKGRKAVPDEKKRKIVEDITRGIGPQMISNHYGVSRATVYNIMREFNVKRPAPGVSHD